MTYWWCTPETIVYLWLLGVLLVILGIIHAGCAQAEWNREKSARKEGKSSTQI